MYVCVCVCVCDTTLFYYNITSNKHHLDLAEAVSWSSLQCVQYMLQWHPFAVNNSKVKHNISLHN